MRISFQAKSFNLGVAAFAGASAAFAVFAMPDPLFARLVALAGGESLFGTVTRTVAMAAAGAGAFLLVWLLLRALDRLDAGQKDQFDDPGEDWLAPRLRRADVHPDAPMPRPILAGHELGEPADDDHINFDDAEPALLDLNGYEAGPWARRPVPVEQEERESGTDVKAAETDAAAEVEQEEVGNEQDSIVAHDLSTDEKGGNVSSLLKRLDTRLAACEWPLPSQSRPQPLPLDGPSSVDDRLRSALDELQKMASRNG